MQTVNPFLEPPEELWWAMCDAGISRPIDFTYDNVEILSKRNGFVYDRRFGLFPCDMGKHQMAMCLFALMKYRQTDDASYQFEEYLEYMHIEEYDINLYSKGQDFFLSDNKGTCFRSSVGKNVYCWNKHSLNADEVEIFGIPKYVE